MTQDKKFVPTADMIKAADALFLAMATLSTIEPIVLNYQRLILREGRWRVKREYVQNGLADEVVLEPDRTFLLDEKDIAVFDSLCKKAQVMVGLQTKVEGNCPLLEAKTVVSEAQAHLVQLMAPVTGHSLDLLLMLPIEKYQQFIDLSLRLLAPFVDPHKRYGIPKPEVSSGAPV